MQINRVEMLFRGDLQEEGDMSGISKKELEAGLLWLENNKAKHTFSPQKLAIIEEELRKLL